MEIKDNKKRDTRGSSVHQILFIEHQEEEAQTQCHLIINVPDIECIISLVQLCKFSTGRYKVPTYNFIV